MTADAKYRLHPFTPGRVKPRLCQWCYQSADAPGHTPADKPAQKGTAK